jgi:hypothetical protein
LISVVTVIAVCSSSVSSLREEVMNGDGLMKEPKIYTTTHRNVISKLELPTTDPRDPRRQLNLVSQKVFDFSSSSEQQTSSASTSTLELEFAFDSNKWLATDEIYDTARGTYQSIIEPFTELPKVYKLESTKEKLFSYRLESLNERKPIRKAISSRYAERMNKNKVLEYLEDQIVPETEVEEEQEGTTNGAGGGGEKNKRKKKKTISFEKLTAEEREELELETIINPFEPPKPWVRKTRLDGEVVYVNEETKQVKTSAPGEVWAEKYKNLEKLVLRSFLPCPSRYLTGLFPLPSTAQRGLLWLGI